ncbi:MAG: DUF6701 domain-containing protein [Burkholderiales bacterium]
MRLKFLATVILLGTWFATSSAALALTCASQTSGNWNVAATWSCGAVPGAADDVQIRNGNSVTIPAGYAAAANSVTFLATNGSARLIHDTGTSTLAVGAGGVTINAPTNNQINSWDVFDGSATVNGAVTLVGGSTNNRVARIRVSAGTLDINGNLTLDAAAAPRALLAVTGAGNVLLAGNFTLTSGQGTLTMAAGSTFTYRSAGTATVATGANIAYRNLVINKPGGTATAAAAPAPPRSLTVAGSLTVQAGVFDVASTNTAVSGNTSLSGELLLSSATGSKTFTGSVTINAVTGRWNNIGNAAVTMGGDLVNNNSTLTPAFVSGSGNYTFVNATYVWASVNGLTFSGNVFVNGRRTNTTTTTIAGNLAGSARLDNGANQTLNIGGNANGIATLDASANGNIVNYNGSAAQIAENTTYYHLRINNTVGPVTLAGAITVLGDLTNNGNFDPAAGSWRVTFGGSVTQNLLGTAATGFYDVTLDNPAGLVLAQDMNVAHNLTLQNGVLTTGSHILFISNPSPTGSNINANASKFIVGNLKKAIPAGSNISRNFEVGTVSGGLRYVPVSATFASVSIAGALTVATGVPDHPAIASSDIDENLSVNRYWTFTNGGTVFTSYSATLTFINPADLDSGTDPLVFIAQRYSPPHPAAGTWSDVAVSTATASITMSGVTGFGDFAVGTRRGGTPGIGRFNAYETSTPPGATTGVIRTKVAGQTFQLDIVAINLAGNAIQTNYTDTTRIEVLNASDNSGALDANACRPSWSVIQTLPNVDFISKDNGRKTVSITENNAWPVVRLRMSNLSGSRVGCSTDAFAIRPATLANLAASDNNNWETAGTARVLGEVTFGTVMHKAGRPFSVRATAQNAAGGTTTNYAGAPVVVLSVCGGAACTPSFGSLALNTAFVAGELVADTASYSEVGAFGLQLVDDAFAAIDNADGSTLGERRVASATVNVGRFVPDHFAVALNTPQFATACAAGNFTYVGQRFAYTVQPVITVEARSLGGSATALYRGNWWRLTNATLSGKAYTAASGTVNTADVPATDPVIRYNGDGLPNPPPLNPGQGTLTFSSGTALGSGLFFTRTVPVAPFDAEIRLAINVADADGVVYEFPPGTPANPVGFGQASAGNGIAFANGKNMRFGRLRLVNASGSNLLPLTLRMEAQHWVAPGYFVTNVDDGCTAVAAASVALGNFQGLTNGDTTPTITSEPFANGVKLIRLSAPGGTKTGSVDVVVNLNATAGALAACPPFATSSTPTAANLAFLRGNWCGGYDNDPKARARFGVYRGSEEVIDIRENFLN